MNEQDERNNTDKKSLPKIKEKTKEIIKKGYKKEETNLKRNFIYTILIFSVVFLIFWFWFIGGNTFFTNIYTWIGIAVLLISLSISIYNYLEGKPKVKVQLKDKKDENLKEIVITEEDLADMVLSYVREEVNQSNLNLHITLSKLYSTHINEMKKELAKVLNNFVRDYNSSRITNQSLEVLSNSNKNLYDSFLDTSKTQYSEFLQSVKTLLQGGAFELGDEYSKELLQTISNKVDNNLNKNFLKAIEKKFSNAYIEKSQYKLILKDLGNLKNRIIEEIKGLNRRANINLGVGSAVSLVAIILLGISVQIGLKDFSSVYELMVYFLPRLSFIILIEIFAFFFLRLYKANLEDIKYYQNEMTNIELKVISLQTAYTKNDSEVMKSIMNELSKTERNFILKKDETTVELEKIKTSHTKDNNLIDVLKEIIKNKK